MIKKMLARIQSDDAWSRLLRGMGWMLIGSVLARGLSIIGAIYVARILAVDAFGGFGVVHNTMLMVGTLLGSGIGLTATKFIASNISRRMELASAILLVTSQAGWLCGILASLVLYFSAPWMAEVVLADDSLIEPLRFGILFCFSNVMAQVQSGQLAGFEKFRQISESAIIGGIASVPLQVAGAWYGGIPGALLGLGVAEFFRCMWLLRCIRTEQRLQHLEGGAGWEHWKTIFSFGIPASIAGALVIPLQWWCVAIVAHQESGYHEIGLYHATQIYRNALVFLATQSFGAVVSVLSSAWAINDLGGVRRSLSKSSMLAFAATSFCSIGMIIVGPFAMAIFGKGFAGQEALLWILAAGAPFQAVNTVGIAALNAIKKPWIACTSTAVFGIVALAWTWMEPSAQGLLWGQAVGSLITAVLIAGYFIAILRR